jgi:hypothetical protein
MEWLEPAPGDEHARSTREQYGQRKVKDFVRGNKFVASKGNKKFKVP